FNGRGSSPNRSTTPADSRGGSGLARSQGLEAACPYRSRIRAKYRAQLSFHSRSVLLDHVVASMASGSLGAIVLHSPGAATRTAGDIASPGLTPYRASRACWRLRGVGPSG